MKITVIGGGSTYTPELISGLLARAETLGLREVCLMDTDAQRLTVVGGFAQRIVQAQGAPFRVTLSGEQRAALSGAAYVITQLRVGQMPARRSDEYLGQRHGLVGQETTGVGGMAKALRTIPVLLSIAADMQAVAPGALLFNFTNPAGLITEALTRYAPQVRTVGVCNVGITAKMHLLDGLAQRSGQQYDPQQCVLHTLGLNHLTWHRGLTVEGRDMWPEVFAAYMDELRADPQPGFDLATVQALGMIPNYYLEYFYYTAREVAKQTAWPPSRAEAVMAIEADLLRRYADPALNAPPPELMQRGGAYYSTLATQLIEAHATDRAQVHVVNLPNRGAVPGWPDDWVLELPALMDGQGAHPLPAEPLPPVCFGLVAQVKMYELLTVEAAVHGDRRAAYQALLAHPLGPSAEKIDPLLDDLLAVNRAYLPQFA